MFLSTWDKSSATFLKKITLALENITLSKNINNLILESPQIYLFSFCFFVNLDFIYTILINQEIKSVSNFQINRSNKREEIAKMANSICERIVWKEYL